MPTWNELGDRGKALVTAAFDGNGTFIGESWDHNEPAAVAEAAYKALGGK